LTVKLTSLICISEVPNQFKINSVIPKP
jgi:hypothetical protein